MKSLLLLLILPVVLCLKKEGVCEVNSRILGGEYAEEGEFPEVVYLSGSVWEWNDTTAERDVSRYACAGSLISDRWVLTAAHCVSPPPPQHFISIRVHPAILHPDYIESSNVIPLSVYPYLHDIALIWLPQPMSSIHPNFKTATLPMQDQRLTSNEVTLVGWGVTSTTDLEIPSKLMKLEHVQLNQTLCRRIWRSEDELLCRYPTESTGNTCHGDSGGPIFMDGIQVGVVSGSMPKEFLGYLISKDTRVSAYRDWIEAQIRLHTS